MFEIYRLDSPIYFAALNKNWDFTHLNILRLSLVIFVFKSSVVYKNSHSVSVKLILVSAMLFHSIL